MRVGFLGKIHLAHELMDSLEDPVLNFFMRRACTVLCRKACLMEILGVHAAGRLMDCMNMAMKESGELMFDHFSHPCLGYMTQIWGDSFSFIPLKEMYMF